MSTQCRDRGCIQVLDLTGCQCHHLIRRQYGYLTAFECCYLIGFKNRDICGLKHCYLMSTQRSNRGCTQVLNLTGGQCHHLIRRQYGYLTAFECCYLIGSKNGNVGCFNRGHLVCAQGNQGGSTQTLHLAAGQRNDLIRGEHRNLRHLECGNACYRDSTYLICRKCCNTVGTEGHQLICLKNRDICGFYRCHLVGAQSCHRCCGQHHDLRSGQCDHLIRRESSDLRRLERQNARC